MLTITQAQKTAMSSSQVPAQPTALSNPAFVKLLSNNDKDLYRTLKSRRIHGFYQLSRDLKNVRRQTEVFRRLNQVLIILCLAGVAATVIAGYHFYTVEYRRPSQRLAGLSSRYERQPPSQSTIVLKQNVSSHHPFSRNIFVPISKVVEHTDHQADQIKRLFQDRYLIVGIVMDTESQVIVEDVKNKTSYFLAELDLLESAQLIEIQPQRVIFKINDQRVELSP